MDRFGVSKPALKIAGAKVGEKLGRLKPNEQLTGYSPLSRVLEIEGLRGGVQAKHGLWDSLAELAKHDDRLDPEEMAELQAKAQNAARRPARAAPHGRARGLRRRRRRLQLGRRQHARQLVAQPLQQPGDLRVGRQAQRLVAGVDRVADAVGARQRVGVARPRRRRSRRRSASPARRP